MADLELVIKIPEEVYKHAKEMHEVMCDSVWLGIKNGTPLPKGHGRLIDIGKIDEDRMQGDNPIIYYIMNGQYIEAIGLDYLNDLPTIIEADKDNSND